MKIKAIVHDAEEGGYWAEVPSLSGVITEGETIQDLETNLREAIEAYLLDETIDAKAPAQEHARVLDIAA